MNRKKDMNRKTVGLILMPLSFLYFASSVWGSFQMNGVVGLVINSVVLILFISGVWCLSATKRKRLGLGLMAFPFLSNAAGIWGGYEMGFAYGGESYALGGMMINAVALVLFLVGVWCLFQSNSRGTSHNKWAQSDLPPARS